jgi:hypothetical protein
MPLLRMRNLISISLLFILTSFPSFGWEIAPDSSHGEGNSETSWSPVFPENFQKGLFRMNFDISKNHITGFLIIKKTSDSSTNIVFSNEFGVCFFFFEFHKGKFLIRTLFPSFNRKSLLSILEKDFRLILFPDTTVKKIIMLQNAGSEIQSYNVSSGWGDNQYSVAIQTKKIKEIRSKNSIFRKTIISLDHYNDDIPWIINILHPVQKIRIKITYLSP